VFICCVGHVDYYVHIQKHPLLLYPHCRMHSLYCTSHHDLCSGQQLSAVSRFLLFPHLVLIPSSWFIPRVPGLNCFGICCDLWFCCVRTTLISGSQSGLAACSACVLPLIPVLASHGSHDALIENDCSFSGVSPACALAHDVT
jgi:hypothetical protein